MKVYFSTPFLNSPSTRPLIAAVSLNSVYGGVSFSSLMPLLSNDIDSDGDQFDVNIKKIDSADIVTILIDPSIVSSIYSLKLTMTVLREGIEALNRGKLCNILVEESIYRDWMNDERDICRGQSFLNDLLDEMRAHPDIAFVSPYCDGNEMIDQFFAGVNHFLSKNVDGTDDGETAPKYTTFTYSYSP